MEERLKELLYDEEYVKQLVELRDPEKISDSLAEHDVELSPEEIEKIIKILKMKLDGDLSDAELENIAGGLDPLSAIAIALTIAVATTGTTLCIKQNHC